MRTLLLFLALMNLSFAQTPSVPKMPTEDLRVPGTYPDQDSSFEEAVESASKIEDKDELSTTEKVKDTASEVIEKASDTRSNRGDSKHSLMVGYELLTSWVPFKKNASYTYIFNEKWSLQAEYAWGSVGLVPLWIVDIGNISEKRYSLLARHYPGRKNSFHFIYGLFHSNFHASVGSDYLSSAGAGARDVFRVRGSGITAGIGNRWQWQNGFTLGVDWFRMNLPLINTRVDSKVVDEISDRSDVKEIKDTIDKLKNLPTFVLLGINLGYTF